MYSLNLSNIESKKKIFIISIIFLSCFSLSLAQEATHFNLKNPEYKIQIDSIFQIDQEVRSSKYRKAFRYIDKYKDSSLRFKQRKKYKRFSNLVYKSVKSDSLNIVRLLDLIEKKGFPSTDKVGDFSYQYAIVILMHYDNDKQNKILRPILDEALLKKEILPVDYATIIDRHLVTNGEKAIYYSWLPCPFLDLSEEKKKEVLDNRHKIGLYGFKFKCGFHKWQIIEKKEISDCKKH